MALRTLVVEDIFILVSAGVLDYSSGCRNNKYDVF